MTNESGLVGNFVDLCEFNGLDPKDGLSVVGRFMGFCKTNELDPLQTASVVADFMNSCELDPAGALEILNAQDWDDPESKSDPITDEQLKAINRSLKEIVGEPTDEQLRSVFSRAVR